MKISEIAVFPEYRKNFKNKRFIDKVTGFNEWIDHWKKYHDDKQKEVKEKIELEK